MNLSKEAEGQFLRLARQKGKAGAGPNYPDLADCNRVLAPFAELIAAGLIELKGEPYSGASKPTVWWYWTITDLGWVTFKLLGKI